MCEVCKSSGIWLPWRYLRGGVAGDEPVFFSDRGDWRRWLEDHHDTDRELWVGFHKKSSGHPSITWPEAVDEALCFGWIDGVRKRIDEDRYKIRFTPRKPGSIWSAVNTKRAQDLADLGLLRPAGLAAFAARDEKRSAVYSYEREAATLEPEQEQQFRRSAQAWEFFQSQPASYRRAAVWWVVSAKREETRRRRLATLMHDSEEGRTVRPLTRPGA